jgi:hypothetical protein
MLELIRCAQAMNRLQLDPDDDDVSFWMHAKSVFNRRFHAMNTSIHSLALFLHPMCRKLAILQAANGRSFEFMVKTALGVAHQWRWNEEKAKWLIKDLKQYYQCRGPFAGGHASVLDWWECLPISAESHPVKALAIVLLSMLLMSRGYFHIWVALKLSNVATFPSILSKRSVNFVQTIPTTFTKELALPGSLFIIDTPTCTLEKIPASMLIWQQNLRPILLGFHLLLRKLHMPMITLRGRKQSVWTRLRRHLTVLRKRWPRRD